MARHQRVGRQVQPHHREAHPAGRLPLSGLGRSHRLQYRRGGLQSHAAAGRAGILCLKGGTCSSPEARGLARAIWPQPWVQGLPERIQGAVCQHGKTYGTAQDGQDEGIILQELKKNRARGPAHTQ